MSCCTECLVVITAPDLTMVTPGNDLLRPSVSTRVRITEEEADVRVTEDGDIRILE